MSEIIDVVIDRGDSDDNDPVALAKRDIELGLGDAFEPIGDGWRVVEALLADGLMSSGRFTAVPWEYTCRHSGDFLGLPPTLAEFAMHGVTIVVRDEDDDAPPIFHRYIDWATVMAELGMGATWRPTLDVLPNS